MRLRIACGVAAGWAAVVAAADPQPVSVYPPVPDAVPPAPAKLQPAVPGTTPPTLPQTTVAARPVPAARLAGTVVPAQATQPMPAPAAARPAATPDVTKPLSSVLESIPPAPPAVPQAVPVMTLPPAHPAPRLVYSGDAGCAPCGDGQPGSGWGWRLPSLTGGSRPTPCLDKLCAWFAWKPGPRVIPVCTPTPYHPPLRHYIQPGHAPNLHTSSAPLVGGSSVGPAGGRLADFFGPRMAGGCNAGTGGCADGNSGTGCGRGGRCDPCHENVFERACAKVTPRQFGERSYKWHFRCPPGPFSDCAQGNCGPEATGAVAAVPAGVAGPAVLDPAPAVGAVPAGGVIYPGVGGGYRFASPVFVPPARPVVASSGGVGGSGGLGGTGGAVGGNVGAVGPGTVGGGSGGTGAGAGGPGGR